MIRLKTRDGNTIVGVLLPQKKVVDFIKSFKNNSFGDDDDVDEEYHDRNKK